MQTSHKNAGPLPGTYEHFDGLAPNYLLDTWVRVIRCASCGEFVSFDTDPPTVGWCEHTLAPDGILSCGEIHHCETQAIATAKGF